MLETVIRNIWEKKKLMDLGDPRHEEIRIAALFPGGFMRGIYQAAEMKCFYSLRLTEIVGDFIGISAGVSPPTYFLGGQENYDVGVSVYKDDLTSQKYINYFRPASVIDWGYLYQTLRFIKPANKRVILESRSNLWFLVTDVETKDFVFLDAKKAQSSLMDAFFSAVAPPRSMREQVLVNGREYCDGGFTTYLPLREICDLTKPTDILIAGNRPQGYLDYSFSFLDEVLIKTLYRKFGAKEMLKRRADGYKENLDFLRNQTGVNIGFLFPPDCKIGFATRNRQKLERAFQITTAYTMNLFNQYKPSD